jgi:hypothetical protein
MHRLEEALAFVEDDLVPELALALFTCRQAEITSVSELEEVLDRDTQEVLLLGVTWRLILPLASGRSSLAWEEAPLSMGYGLRLKMPAVVRHLVEEAGKSGLWRPEEVLGRTSPLLPQEPEPLAELMSCIRQYAPGSVISGNEIGAALREVGIEASLDTLIAHWKGAGVMSPRLSSLRGIAAHRSPQYEINPSIFSSKSPRNDAIVRCGFGRLRHR